jgi:hypothetical protein
MASARWAVAGLGGRLRNRTPRWLRNTLLVVAAAYILFLLAMNIFLGTGLFRSLANADEDTLRIDYRSAYSLWPGRVVADDLSLRFQDDNVQFLLEIERADIDVALFALARRTFHVRKVEAEGVSFRLRLKTDSPDENPQRLAAYPPIAGFTDPPVRPAEEDPPIPEEEYDLWTIHLEEVAASVRELWIQEFRYRGDGAVAGGFRLRPLRELWLAPSVLVTRGGALSIGDRDVLRGADGRLEAQIELFDVRVPTGAAVLRHVSARSSLHGEVVSVAPVADAYLADSEVQLLEGAGALSVDARLDHGVLGPATRLSYRTDALVIEQPPLRGRAVVEATARVEGDHLVAESRVPSATLSVAGESAAYASDASAALTARHADLAGPLGLRRLEAGVSAARIPDLSKLQPALPRDVVLRGGSAGGALKLASEDGTIDGRLDVSLDRARMMSGDTDVTATGKIWVNAASEDVTRAVAFPASGVELERVSFGKGDAREDGLAASVRLDGAVLDRRSGPAFDSRVAVELRPGDRVMRIVASMVSLPEWVGAAAATSDVRARARLGVSGERIAVRDLAADVGRLSARGHLVAREGNAEGRIILRARPLTTGVEVAADGGVRIVPFAGHGWLSR